MLRTRRSIAPLAVPLFALALLVGACGGDSEGASEDSGPADQGGIAPGEATAAPEATGAPDEDAEDGGLAFGEIPVQGPSIVKVADLSVLVERDEFEAAFNEATLVASRYGGFIHSSRTSGSDSRSGSVTIRVPASSFEQAMADIRRIGKVTDETVSGEDVSAQFVDLEARQRTWEAQEAVLLELMGEADTIEETLTVQRHLQDVQLRIEEISGQLRSLRDRTDLSTITVAIREKGAPAPKPTSSTGVPQPSLGNAWDEARAGFLKVISAVVVTLGYLIPVALFGLVLWVLWRRFGPDLSRAEAAHAAGRFPPPPDAS
jgi:hypothetical protein